MTPCAPSPVCVMLPSGPRKRGQVRRQLRVIAALCSSVRLFACGDGVAVLHQRSREAYQCKFDLFIDDTYLAEPKPWATFTIGCWRPVLSVGRPFARVCVCVAILYVCVRVRTRV